MINDIYGREINAGDYAVYAIVNGQSAYMRVGIVTKVTGGRNSRVSMKGCSRWQDRWIVTKGSVAWAGSKIMIIPKHSIPFEVIQTLEENK
jgi:hypothetical protein